MAVANRKEIEKLIYDVFDALDPSGVNTDKYRTIFSSMDDKAFEKYMKDFLGNKEENFMLDIVEYEHDLSLAMCEKAAKVLKIPLFEYIFMPHLTMDKNNIIRSKQKCLVGYMPTKRTQQFLHKKNALSTSNDRINPITGQVTRDDKNARDTDIEASMLIALGADKILQELHGVRADDPVMKREAIQSINTKGFIEMDELENNPVNKVTLNTVNTYLLSMGLITDLITDTYILPKTSEEFFS